jgi:hypothetical protein
MKKVLTMMAAALVLLTSACKKEDSAKEETTTSGTGTNTYTLGGTTYTVVYSGVTQTNGKYNYIFADRTPAAGMFNFLSVSFKTAPTSGTYQLISLADNAPISAANQCQIGASNNTTLGYGYIGTGAVNIDVVVTGGKIKITIPEISVIESATSGSTATVKLSGTVKDI